MKKTLSAKTVIQKIGADATTKLLNDFLSGDGITLSDDDGLIVSNYMQYTNYNFFDDDNQQETIRRFVFINLTTND